MKIKSVFCIIIFLIINMICINFSYGYTFPDNVEIDENNVSNISNAGEIIEIGNKIIRVNVEKLEYDGIVKFNKVINDFETSLDNQDPMNFYGKIYEFTVKGADLKEIYDKLSEKDGLTVSERVYKKAYELKKEILNVPESSAQGQANAGKTKKYDEIMLERSEEGTDILEVPESSALGSGGTVVEKTEEELEQERKQAQVIYKNPSKISKADKDNAGDNIEQTIIEGNEFIQVGEAKQLDLVSFSNAFYNIFLIIGTALTVIVGIILGINIMMATVDKKAEAKQLLLPYVAGCVIIYGAFGIWKLAVTIMGSL